MESFTALSVSLTVEEDDEVDASSLEDARSAAAIRLYVFLRRREGFGFVNGWWFAASSPALARIVKKVKHDGVECSLFVYMGWYSTSMCSLLLTCIISLFSLCSSMYQSSSGLPSLSLSSRRS